MAGAKHPLIAPYRTHAPAHLVGQRLETEAAIRGGKSAGEAIAQAFDVLRSEKDTDGFFIAAVEQLFITGERNPRAGFRDAKLLRKIKTIDRVQEEQRAHAFVEILVAVAQTLKFRQLGDQPIVRCALAERAQRAIADFRIGRADDVPEFAHALSPSTADISRAARTLTSSVSTSSRSWPLIANANCAVKSPYLTPTSNRRPCWIMARDCSRCASVPRAADKLTRPVVSASIVARISKIAGVSTCMP